MRPPRAERELRAPKAAGLLRSWASGIAEARGVAAFEVEVPVDVDDPSRFAFCSSTLLGRDRSVVRAGRQGARLSRRWDVGGRFGLK